MELEKKVKVLQGMYAGVLADSVLRMGREGILQKVADEKRAEQLQNGKMRAAQMGITEKQDVFAVLSDIFGCANWETTDAEYGFTAEASACMLCSLAKRMGAESPCNIYCLDPMEAMVKGMDDNANFTVQETLWEGQKCHVFIT